MWTETIPETLNGTGPLKMDQSGRSVGDFKTNKKNLYTVPMVLNILNEIMKNALEPSDAFFYIKNDEERAKHLCLERIAGMHTQSLYEQMHSKGGVEATNPLKGH